MLDRKTLRQETATHRAKVLAKKTEDASEGTQPMLTRSQKPKAEKRASQTVAKVEG